jgi:hypothetical protein
MINPSTIELDRGLAQPARHSPEVTSPTAATSPSPTRIAHGLSHPARPTDSEEPRAQAVIDRDSLAGLEPVQQAEAPEHQVSQADGGGGDQCGRQHDRHALGQVLDVTQLFESLTQI